MTKLMTALRFAAERHDGVSVDYVVIASETDYSCVFELGFREYDRNDNMLDMVTYLEFRENHEDWLVGVRKFGWLEDAVSHAIRIANEND